MTNVTGTEQDIIIVVAQGIELGQLLPFSCFPQHIEDHGTHDVYTGLSSIRPIIETLAGNYSTHSAVLCMEIGPYTDIGPITLPDLRESLNESIGSRLDNITTRDLILSKYTDAK